MLSKLWIMLYNKIFSNKPINTYYIHPDIKKNFKYLNRYIEERPNINYSYEFEWTNYKGVDVIKLLDILREDDNASKIQKVCNNIKQDIKLCIIKLNEYKNNGQLDTVSDIDGVNYILHDFITNINELNCDELDYILEKCYYFLYTYGTDEYRTMINNLEQELPNKSNELDQVDNKIQNRLDSLDYIINDMGIMNDVTIGEASHTSSSQRAVMANRRKTDWLLRKKLAMRRKRNKVCNTNHAKWSAKEHKCVYYDKVAGDLLAIKAKMRRKNM